MSDADDVEEEEGSGGGLQLETLKSYLAFARRAIRKRVPLSLFLFCLTVAGTAAIWRYLPRTFICTTVMMGESNKVFGDWQPQPFSGAGNLIKSKENLEAIARDSGIVKTYRQRRPPILQLKDRAMESLFGRWDDDVIKAIVVGTLESRIDVQSDGGTLSVSVAWSDGATAALLAEAARESFLKVRRSTETAAFTEKMAILDRHATQVRQEVEQLADQISRLQTAPPPQAAPAPSGSAPPPPPRAAPRRLVLPRTASEGPDPDQEKRKEDLVTMKRRLSDLEGERERQLREERAKLAELRLKLAPSHPNVLTSEQRIAMLSQTPSDIVLLRAEVAGLEQEITQRDSMTRLGVDPGRRGVASGPAPAEADSLPAAITDLLAKNDVDQALLAQLSGAVTQYGSLRAQIRSERIEIDTADAAFSQRYRVVVPAEPPNTPVKPKATMVLGAGFGLALLLALLLPILLELRTGIIVERWQVQHMQLPVLAELRLPPRAGD